MVEGLLADFPLDKLADGPHRVQLKTTMAGEESTDAVSVLVDNTPPVLAISQVGTFSPLHGKWPTQDLIVNGAVEVRGVVEDANLKEWELVWGEPPWATRIASSSNPAPKESFAATWSAVGGAIGKLRFVGTDKAGNKTTSFVGVTVDTIVPEVEILQPAADATVPAGANAISAKIYDPRLLSWALEWGEGAFPKKWLPIIAGTHNERGTIGKWNPAGLTPGRYTLRLTAKDRGGLVATTIRQIVVTSLPASPLETAAPAAPPTFIVQWEEGALSLRAERADLTLVLKRVGEITGAAVEISAGVTGEVTISFSKVTLEEAIGQILQAADAKSYAASFERTPLAEGFRLEKIRVVPKGVAEPGNGLGVGPRTFEGARAYLKNKYGTEWNVHWPEDKSGQRSQRPDEIRGHVPVPHRIIDLAEGKAFVESTMAELSELLQVDMSDYVLEESEDAGGAFVYFYRQIHKGVPVDAGQITVSLAKEFVDGRQRLRIGNRNYPGIDLPTEPQVSAERAARTAESIYRTKVGHEGKGQHKLLIYAKPIKVRVKGTLDDAVTGYEYHLVWEFDFHRWEDIRIDALTGRLVTAGYSNVRN